MHVGLVRLLARYLTLALAVVLLNFFIPRALPGDPLSFGAGDGTDTAVPLPAAARERLRGYYHLDEPLGRQLTLYLGDLRRGDLGRSIARSGSVGGLIADRLPWTLGLLLVSLLVSAAAGTAAGVIAGWVPGRSRDRVLTSLAGGLAAIPEFLIAIGLLATFSARLGWFPLFGGQTVFADRDEGAGGMLRRALDITWHLTLPATALALAGAAAFLLLTREAIAGVRWAPWLTTARAKGLRERDVAMRHALPNVAIPLLTFFGLRLGSVLGGALVIERVFGVPGLGLLGYEAIRARDYPLLQALFLLSSLGVLAVNLLVDVVSLHLVSRRGPGRG